MRQVYLDYSATTPVKEEVWKAMLPYYTDFYGNPSSLYSVGLEAKAGVDKARKQVADLINAEEREITFTSCGTEADNWSWKALQTSSKKRADISLQARSSITRFSTLANIWKSTDLK